MMKWAYQMVLLGFSQKEDMDITMGMFVENIVINHFSIFRMVKILFSDKENCS